MSLTGTKISESETSNILQIKINQDLLDKLCFRETLLISKSKMVENNREIRPTNFDDNDEAEFDVNDELFNPQKYLNSQKEEQTSEVSQGDMQSRKLKKLKCKRLEGTDATKCDSSLNTSGSNQNTGPQPQYCDLDFNPDDDDDSRQADEVEESFMDSRPPKELRILLLDGSETSGAFCMNIESIQNNLLMYTSTQFAVDGHAAGSTVLTTCDFNFSLIEEKKSEFIIRDEDIYEETCLHVALDDEQYIVVKAERHGEVFEKTTGRLEISSCKDLLFDGAGMIMMRYFAVTNFRGIINLTTMLMNGDIAKVTIRSNGHQNAWLCNNFRPIIKIEKIIVEECGIVHRSLTIMTPTGHLVKHEWADCDFVIHINPLCDIPAICSGLVNSWGSDIEMLSRFLDYKAKRKALHKNYLTDKPEVKAIVSDYIEYILLSKPADILDYTIKYFKCLRPED